MSNLKHQNNNVKNSQVAAATSLNKELSSSSFQFEDKRPETIAQQKIKREAGNSLRAKQAAQLKAIVQRVNSADITLTQHATVARAPTGMSANRFSDAGTSIHQVSLEDFPGGGGTIVDGSDSGARVDKQGNFDAAGKSWANIQVQANRTDGGADYTDLTYPDGTAANQRGTSFAEVHVDQRIVGSDQDDVLNRGKRLLKQGLMRSRGDRGTTPRPSFRITYD